ncbi:MAG TPA: ABC transporter permease [Verrucomicrobiae bacterium]|nr:ABC transporter permease [Verrucomicrobiae bacterium]
MQAYWTLVRRELGSHFFSWTGYIVIAAVLLLLGLSFVDLLTKFNGESMDQPLTSVFYSTLYFWLILLLAAPVITMRSFAHEKATGTFETLMTTPVSDTQVVLAKFTGALLFYVFMCVPLLTWVFIARPLSNVPGIVDGGTIAATFLGIFLWGCLYMALGCLASATTRNQIIAAIVSLAIGISLFMLSYLAISMANGPDWRAQVFSHVGLIEHMKDFARGVVDTRPIVFYLTFTGFFLYLTLKVVESRRWK